MRGLCEAVLGCFANPGPHSRLRGATNRDLVISWATRPELPSWEVSVTQDCPNAHLNLNFSPQPASFGLLVCSGPGSSRGQVNCQKMTQTYAVFTCSVQFEQGQIERCWWIFFYWRPVQWPFGAKDFGISRAKWAKRANHVC